MRRIFHFLIGLLPALSGFSSPQPCDPPPSGLVSWWRGEDNANDSIGANNGFLSPSGAGYASGLVGQAFQFDGTNGYVEVPDSPSLKPANVTVEAWIWLDPSLPSTTGSEQIVFKKNTWSAWFEGYSLLKDTIDNGDGAVSNLFEFVVSRDGDQVQLYSQTVAQRGVWYHIAGTYDGNQATLYVDGVAESSAVAGFALDYDTTPLFIGTSGTWPPYLNMFGGLIDEVSIYDRALSSDEIAAIYNAGSAGKCAPAPPICDPPPPGLVSWWKGEDDADDSISTNNGALSATGAGYAPGLVGQAFQFDGANGYVEVPDSPSLKPANVTVEAWVWLDPSSPSTNGSEQIVFKKNTWSAWFEGYSLLKDTIDNGDGAVSNLFEFVVSREGDQVVIFSQTVAQRGVWYHVAATYDGNQSTLYVDGVAEATATAGFALDYDTTPLFIGTTGTWPPYLNMFGGLIDEVSIYDRALSSNEIAAIYNAGSAGKCFTAPPPPACDPPPSGLVSWWRGEDDADDSINTNNGFLSPNGAGYAPGFVGEAFRFDGTNGYVEVPDSPSLKPANVTVEAWIWLDPSLPSTTGSEQIVFKKNTWSAWFEGYSLLKDTVDNGDGAVSNLFEFVVSRDGDQVVIFSQTVAQRGVWYHIAGTYDGNQLTLYVDGVAEASATAGFALDYDTTPLYIGTSGAWPPYLNMFGGLIDEVSIYDRALSSSEIAAIYNAGSAGKCVPAIQVLPTGVTTGINTPISVAAAKLLLNTINNSGDALALTDVNFVSANGGANTLASGIVTYTPPTNFVGLDTFLYTVSDAHGNTATGPVNVTVSPTSGPPQNALFSPRAEGGNLTVNFAGIPGLTYTIETASSPAGPWIPITNCVAPLIDQGQGEGVFLFQAPAATASQFYRAFYSLP